jgi:hypothetical protein
MKIEDFVSAIEACVLNAAVESTVSMLRQPPGRRVDPVLAARSEWFSLLSDTDVEMVCAVIHEAASSAVFGFLVVLDGARVIDDEKGTFELYYVGREKNLLNPPDIALHEFLR